MQVARARELAGEQRGIPGVEVCLAGERGIQRLQLLGRLQQQQGSIAATRGERDLPVH